MLPKASRMESFTGNNDKSDPGTFVSSVPHLVVECPSCTTKFSVESTAVAAIEEPRFHCSRCDAVFSLEHARQGMASSEHRRTADYLNSEEHVSRSSEIFSPELDIHSQSVSSEVAATEVRSKSSDYADYEPQSGIHSKENFEREAPVPANIEFSAREDFGTQSPLGTAVPFGSHPAFGSQPITANTIPSPIRPSDFSVHSDSETQRDFLASQSGASESSDISGRSIGDFAAPERPRSFVKEPLLNRDDSEIESSVVESLTGDLTHKTVRATVQPNEPEIPSLVSPPKSTTSKANPSRKTDPVASDLRAERAAIQPTSYWQTVIILSTPLVVALACLTILSYSMRMSPQGLGAVFSRIVPALGPQASEVPPADLAVTKASLHFVQLQTKEVVPVITGVIANRSQRPIEGVKLEGLGFDQRGEVLMSSQAPLRSALSREKVSELSLADIKKFQVALSARKSAIGVGEEVPFSIALLADADRDGGLAFSNVDPGALKYFSARVFSVAAGSR